VWWTDARADPWRDPSTLTEIVVPAPPADPPETEPVPDPTAPAAGTRVRLLPVVLAIAVLAGLLAGGVGGLLGYTYGIRDQGGGTPLGGNPGTAPLDPAQQPGSQSAVVDRVLPSVVTIRSAGSAGTHLGSGFVVTADGHVITNDHVVGGGDTPSVVTFHDGTTARAELVGREPESDLAVLRVERPGVQPVPLGDSALVRVGDPVLAFGSPLALANTVTSGIVSAVDRTIRSGEPGEQVRYYAAIQTDAAVNQGNSGGPLVDAAGRVIGVNSVIKSVAENADEAANIGLAFAIPINQAKRIAQEIIDLGHARRTVIGAEFDQSGQVTGAGVRVSSVVAEGPADQAGLRPGDVLVRFGETPVLEPADLIALVRKEAPGTVVTVSYRRGADEANTTVTLVADNG
jgi:putative serine protease PepD